MRWGGNFGPFCAPDAYLPANKLTVAIKRCDRHQRPSSQVQDSSDAENKFPKVISARKEHIEGAPKEDSSTRPI